jgi:hypothetical protein
MDIKRMSKGERRNQIAAQNKKWKINSEIE